MKIKLSIIIPVYKAKDTLPRAINSINNQNIKFDNFKMEIIIIIDDGKEYKKIIPKLKKGIAIKLIKTNGIKTGPGNARNCGIAKAKGEFVGFLDADDEWSENYLRKMLELVKKNGIAFAPTRVYDQNNFIIKHFEGKRPGYIDLNDIGNIPCSFHPFIKKKKQKKFEKIRSQDVYNTAYILNGHNTKIRMIDGAYYKLNLQEKSVTKEDGFSHKINLAYIKYQIKSLKNKNLKIAKMFAIRRINNIKYINWKKNNINKSFYEYLNEKEN